MEHVTFDARGLSTHYVTIGDGPTVVLLHGFPEGWSTWRHQLTALAEAGYRAVAPDMRGYGATDAPTEAADYTAVHLVGDVVSLIDHLGADPVVVVGHDWGCAPAWHTALMRPDLVRAVIGTSVPFTPPSETPTLEALDRAYGGRDHYQRWFQTDAAQEEAESDVRRLLLAFYDAISGHHGKPASLRVAEGATLLGALEGYGEQPPWLTDEHLDELVEAFTRSGFRGPMNWYRASPYNVTALRPWRGMTLRVPAGYITGDLDGVYRWPGMAEAAAALPMLTPQHLGNRVIPGCGHWTGEERPAEVNGHLLEMLAQL